MKKQFLLLLMMALTVFAFPQSYVQIGSGTLSTSYPPYSVWNNGWYTAIYPQSAIGTAKSITKISFECINGPKSFTNQKIYMKHTSAAVFSSASYEDPTNNGYTLVYDGTINYNSWTDIILTTPFAYNGTDNLIIHYENRSGSSNYANFNSTTSSTNNNKSAGDDVSFPTVSGYLNPYPYSLPNVRLYYSTTGPVTPSNPVPADNADKVLIDAVLYFDLGANTTSYDLYYSNDSLNVLNLNPSVKVVNNAAVSAPGTFSYDPPALMSSKTRYFWRVVAKNGTLTENSPLWKFRTQMVITTFPYTQGFEDSTVFYPGWYGQRTDWTYTTSGNNAVWNTMDGLNPHTGTYCAYVSPLSGTTESPLMSPRIILPAGYKADFFWRAGSSSKIASSDTTFFEITTNGGSSWTTLDTLAPVSSQTSYQHVNRDLSAFAGNNVYMRWRYKLHTYVGSRYVYLDDITISQNTNAAEILLQPSSYTFNEVYIGGHTSKKVAITNNGTQNLVITGVNVSAPFNCTYTGTIAPGHSDTAIVTFTPASAGTFSQPLTFTISGSYSGNNVLNLTATGLTPLNSFFEAFDLATALPAHWNKIISPTDVNCDVTVIVTSDAYSPPNCAKMLNMNDSISPLLMITPGVTNFNGNTLKFRAKTGGSYSSSLIIGLMTDPYDASTFVADTTIVANSNYALYVVHFNTSNTIPYIAFKHGETKKVHSFRIDDVAWESSAPVPPNPAQPIYPADNATSVDIMMGLNLQWANGGGSPDAYRVYFGQTNPPTTLINDTTGTSSWVPSVLNYSTVYYWKVIPYNQYGTDSANCPVWKFTTMADPTKNLPWSENFDALTQTTGYTYPLGWSYQNFLTGQTNWDLIVNNSGNPNNAHSAPNAMVSGPQFYPKNNWLYTPPLHINPGLGLCQVSFWYKAVPSGVSNDMESMRLTIGSNHYTSAITDTLWNHDTVVNTTYQMGSVIFAIGSEANYFIGFHAHSPSDYPTVQNFALIVDDVSVDYVSSVEENSLFFGTYPNPASDYLIISIPQWNGHKTSFEIMNLLGQKVYTAEMKSASQTINLNGLKQGMYIIRMDSEGKSYTRKIVVK
jgi:hypothetical protein